MRRPRHCLRTSRCRRPGINFINFYDQLKFKERMGDIGQGKYFVLYIYSMNERLQTMMDFKGYGNPQGKYWFIGVEEALAIDSEKKLEPYKKGIDYYETGGYTDARNQFKRENPKKRYTSVYDIIGKIILKAEKGDDNNLIEFLDNHLFQKDGNNFYTIIYPLGKKKLTDNLSQKTLDFMGLRDMKEYLNKVRKYRFNKVYEYWTTARPLITICFGIGNWIDFRKIFHLDESQKEVKAEGKIEYYPQERIYLVPYFINHQMSGKMIDSLSCDIKKRMKNIK